MKDTERQILELQKDLSDCLQYDIEDSNIVDTYDTAFYMVNKFNYQKIDKDSVVLSREELHKTEENAYQVGITLGKKFGAKETAEKCKQDLSQLLKEHFGPGFYRLSCRDVIDDYFEKQWGLKEDTIKRILGEDIEKDEK